MRVCLILSLLTIGSHFANAQTDEPQSALAAGQALVRVPRTHHPLARPENDAGRVEAGRTLHRVVLTLTPGREKEAELANLLDDLQNRTSPNYHRWLSAVEFGARFGAADADVASLRQWLEGTGLQVELVAASKRWLEFTGTVDQVERALHTEMHYYCVGANTFVGNATDIAIPAELSSTTRGVLSLNNFDHRPPVHTAGRTAPRSAASRASVLRPNLTASGATNTYYLAPGDFVSIYNTTGLLNSGVDGSGVSIAVTAQSDIELSDVQQFRQIFGLKANDPNVYVSGPDPGVAGIQDSNEALLDTEWAGAVAPGATISVVIAASTDTTKGVDLAAMYAIDNEVAPIVTYTYGACEQSLGTAGNAFYNSLWAQAAAEGITAVVAAGDSGAAGCDSPSTGVPAELGPAVNGAASTPYNVAVGGTEFAEGANPATFWSGTNSANYSSALGYIPENAWNEACDTGQSASTTNCAYGGTNMSLLSSGGGPSTVYGKPGWQTGPGVPADMARDVPDVALAAASMHDEFVYCTSLGGIPCQVDAQNNVTGLTLVGGTSGSTPAMAGILALVEHKNGAFQGQVNYILYRLAAAQGNSCNSSNETKPTAQNSCVFYDVTAGNNAVPCGGGSPGCSSTHSGVNGTLPGETAGAGYDLVTGLGSINVTNLAAAWKNVTLAGSQTSLQASSLSFAHGTPITLNGTVAPASGSGTPTGAVSVKTDAGRYSSQMLTLTSGAFSGTVSDLPGGQYDVFAHYAGDATYATSDSAAVLVNVTPENSATTLTVDGLTGGSAGYGDALQVKVKTTANSGNGIATGSVTLQDNHVAIGTYTLAADGSAYIQTGGGSSYSFSTGAHSLSAMYSGDSSFHASTSSAVPFQIAKGTPFVVVGVNTPSVPLGETIGAHVVVSGSGTAAATGSVQFTVDGAAYAAPIAMQTGGFFGTQAQAQIVISGLKAGSHTIGASYNGSGDPNFNSVASGDPNYELTQTVTVGSNLGTATTATLTVNSAPLVLGGTGSFTVKVSPSAATGSVTLWDTVGPRTTATAISGGSATIQFPWTQAGNVSLYAVYSGDAANAASASNVVNFTVQPGVPQVQLSAPASASSTQQVSLSATVAGTPSNPLIPYPTGVVEFWDALNGGAAQLLASQILTAGAGRTGVSGIRVALAAGSHSLYVHYRGDTNWQAGNSTSVPLASSTFSVSESPNPIAMTGGSPGSGTVTVTPIGGFAGTVVLMCGTGGTMIPAGYTCGFGQSSLDISGTGAANTSLNLTPSSRATGAVKAADAHGQSSPPWGTGLTGGLLLFGLALLSAGTHRRARNFALAAGFVLAAVSAAIGCGGGGGGGGTVNTTTTISSSNLKVSYQTPITFTVTVKPNGAATPSGLVQLFDNGQALGGQVKVNAGIASFLASSLPVGVHNITAQYLGDATTGGSTSAPVMQVITGTVALQISGTAGGNTQTADFNVMVN